MNKRRLDALDKELFNYADYSNNKISIISFLGERSVKRRREISIKAVTNFVLKPKLTIQYITQIRILIRALTSVALASRVLSPYISAGEL